MERHPAECNSGEPEALGNEAYDEEPSIEIAPLRRLLEERKNQREHNRTWNKVLASKLDKNRLQSLIWCSCVNGPGQNCCTTEHKRPKASFCCKEAASATTGLGLAYRAKIECTEATCITEVDGFHRRALDREKIEGWAEIIREQQSLPLPANFDNRELRRAAYRSVTLWIHGTMGAKNRAPLSSCIVNAIRKAFPNAPEEAYTDYASGNEGSSESEEEIT